MAGAARDRRLHAALRLGDGRFPAALSKAFLRAVEQLGPSTGCRYRRLCLLCRAAVASMGGAARCAVRLCTPRWFAPLSARGPGPGALRHGPVGHSDTFLALS